MPVQIPTKEPSVLTIGTSWDWDKALGNFPASEGWQLTYYLVSKTASGSDLTLAWGSQVTADGDTFQVRCAPSFSADATLTPGAHDLIGVVTDGTDTYTLPKVSVDLMADPATLNGSRSHAAFMLDAIVARQKGRVLSQEQRQVRINGRSIEYVDDVDLRKAESYWRLRVLHERSPKARLTHAARMINA